MPLARENQCKAAPGRGSCVCRGPEAGVVLGCSQKDGWNRGSLLEGLWHGGQQRAERVFIENHQLLWNISLRCVAFAHAVE